jgi:crotonobetainyl-CoA:carnitine CoA-transferase CaiB-like acyl-CoA transferase
MGNAHPSICPYEVYPTRDRGMVIAVGNDTQFGVFTRLLGLPELATEERFATNAERVAHRAELNALIAPVLLTRGADDWHEALLTAGIPNGPINNLAEAFSLAETLELHPLVTIPGADGDQRHVAHPARYSGTAVEYRLPAPTLGQHTDEIIAEFSLDDPHGSERTS